MLDQLAALLTGRARGRTLDLTTAPPDVLLQSAIVLRSLDAAFTRLDLDTGALEARLAAGCLLRLCVAPAGDGSCVVIEAAVCDLVCGPVSLVLVLDHGC